MKALILPTSFKPPDFDTYIRGNPKLGGAWASAPSQLHDHNGWRPLTNTDNAIINLYQNTVDMMLPFIILGGAEHFPHVRENRNQNFRIDALWKHGCLIRQIAHGPTTELYLNALNPQSRLATIHGVTPNTPLMMLMAREKLSSAHAKANFIATLPKEIFYKTPDEYIFVE